MKKGLALSLFVAVLSATSLFADVALTDKAAAFRLLSRNENALPALLKLSTLPLSPAEREQLRAQAKEAKRAAKLAAHSRGNAQSLVFRPRALATGSVQLIDASGVKYFINTNITFSTSSSASGGASEASYTHSVSASTLNGGVVQSRLNDAYDGYNTMCVSLTGATGTCQTGNAAWNIYVKNGPASFDATVPAVPFCTNRQVVFPVKTVGGLQMQRKVYVPTNDSYARWENIFTNTTGAPITFTVAIANNLGSDANTVIVTDSSGNASPTAADRWVTTFQNYSGTTTSDPRLGHVLQGVGAPTPVSALNFANGDDNPWWNYTVTLNPGQTKIIINFGVAQPSKAAAATKSAQLALFGANAQQCLSTTELNEVANFEAGADLSIAKTSSPVGTVSASQPITYTLTVTNSGPSTASSVLVSDTLPAGETFVSASGTGWACNQVAGTVNCALSTLAVGPATPITISATAPANPGTLSNTATVSSATFDPNAANNSSTNTLTGVPVADLTMTKTSTPAGTVNAGQPFSYTLNVNNLGPSTATSLTVTDPLPAGAVFGSVSGTGWTCGQAAGTVTCTMPSLAVGAANPITINLTAPANSAVLTNTATVSSATNDSNEANNFQTNVLTVVAVAGLSLTNTASSGSVNIGTAYHYTLTVNNAGPSTATSVSVSNPLPAGVTFVSASGTGWTCNLAGAIVTCTLPTLAVGAANPISINVTAPANGGVVSDTATVTSATTAALPINNGATSIVSVVASADLAITKSTTYGRVFGGFPVTYTLAVTNNGPTAASSVSVSDALPAGATFISASGTGWTCGNAANVVTCTMPTLAVGAAAPITLTMTAPSPLTPGTLTNTATVSSTTTDPVPGNNSGSSSIPILPASAIPAMSDWVLLILGAAMAVAGVIAVRRQL